jgi:hypothetical protein
LFPFQVELINIDRDSVAGSQGDGTFVIITTPNEGLAAPSTDWDGPLTNFFNDNAGCTVQGNNTPGQDSTDCYRYEEFDDVILALGASAWQEVGFDLDLSVTDFQFRAIVAADLANAAVNTPPTGNFEQASYSGTVPNNVTVRVLASDGVAPGAIQSINFDLDDNGTFEFVGTLGGPATARFADAQFACTPARVPGPTVIDAEITDNQNASIVVSADLTCAFPPADLTIDTQAPTSATAGSSYDVTITVQNVSFGPVSVADIQYNGAPQGATGFVLAGCTNALCTDGGVATRTINVTAGGAGTQTTHTGTVNYTGPGSPESDVATTDNVSQPNILLAWFDAGGAPITSAQVGDVVTLQICSTGPQRADMSTFSGIVGGFSALAAPVVASNVSDLATVTEGLGGCADVAATDRLDQPTVFVEADQDINLVNVTNSGQGIGVQGFFEVDLTLDAAGPLNVTLTNVEMSDFTFGTIPPSFTIPTLTVLP